MYVWGYSKACGSKTDVLSPSSVYSCSEQDSVVDMAGGDSHSMILTSSGTVYSWGNNFEVRKLKFKAAIYFFGGMGVIMGGSIS